MFFLFIDCCWYFCLKQKNNGFFILVVKMVMLILFFYLFYFILFIYSFLKTKYNSFYYCFSHDTAFMIRLEICILLSETTFACELNNSSYYELITLIFKSDDSWVWFYWLSLYLYRYFYRHLRIHYERVEHEVKNNSNNNAPEPIRQKYGF